MSPRQHAVSRTFDPAAESVRAARRFVAETLRRHDLEDAADRAVLLVSELVTNAVLHARTAIGVHIALDDRMVRVEIEDGSHAAPAARSFSALAGSGRGLRLVEAVAQSWGVVPKPDGKIVWFQLPADDGGDEGDDENGMAFDLDAVEPL
ncbi:MAG TPA: ATP-binding protein [Acidimicrobiales bacterium]